MTDKQEPDIVDRLNSISASVVSDDVVLRDAAAEIERLRERIAELEADAARYRWLRDTNEDRALRPDIAEPHTILEPNVISQIWYGLPEDEWNLFVAAITCEPGKKMDAAIDAAMKGTT